MSKNTKKKNAIRFGAIAVAALLFLGVFSAWAQGADAQATAGIGEIAVDGIDVEGTAEDELLEGSIAGRPGTVNANESDPYELFEITEDTDDEALTDYEYLATIYLTNGAELIDNGVRYLTLEINISGETDVVSLDSGRATITFEWHEEETPMYVNVTGGSWATFPFASFDDGDTVDFLIDIEPGEEIEEE